MKPIALYCRTSTRKQHTENQEPALIEWAKTKGFQYQLFNEQQSAVKSRPIRQSIIDACWRGEFSCVACLRMDRWMRSYKDIEVLRQLVEHGIDFYFVAQGFEFSKSNSDSAMGKLQLAMLCAFAEFERDILRERIFDGLDRAGKEGRHPGRPKGSLDHKERRKAGYWLRWANSKNIEKSNRKTPPQFSEQPTEEADKQKMESK